MKRDEEGEAVRGGRGKGEDKEVGKWGDDGGRKMIGYEMRW